MGRKPEATSIPPNTAEIDTDWSDTSSVVDSSVGDSAGPTAVPPEPYEEYARRVSMGDMSDEEARRALSAPSIPAIDPKLAPLADLDPRDSGELEAAIPTLGHQVSGPYAIPLELEDDGQQVHPSERPTTPQLEPPPPMARKSTPVPPGDASEHGGKWGEEAPTPTVASTDLLDALRRESSPKHKPPIRRGSAPEDPDVTVEVGEPAEIDLDEPTGIPQEDSLELSLDNVPPAPFDLSPPPGQTADESSRDAKSDDPLALALECVGDALDLVDARATPVVQDPDDPLVDLRDRYAVGDFTGAHEIAEAILADDPDNTEALRFRESCRDVLIQMYTARIGATSRMPKLAIPTNELQWLSLDHRAGFLLSCIDGRSTVEEILDVSGMPALDALRILYTLLQQQIIEMVGD